MGLAPPLATVRVWHLSGQQKGRPWQLLRPPLFGKPGMEQLARRAWHLLAAQPGVHLDRHSRGLPDHRKGSSERALKHKQP